MKRQLPVMDIRSIFGNGRWDQRFCQKILFEENSDTENRVINLYPEVQYETFEGFGGAITDGSGYIYSLMDEEQKRILMDSYFSPQRMNYQFVRIPIDSCDFSLEQFEAMSDPEDREMKSFSLKRPWKYILPMLRDAEAAAGKKIPIMLTPWSPPAFMKTNGKREKGGKLKEEYREFWAEYICRYIEEFQKAGFCVRCISLQNEPKAVQTWDSCIFTAEEEKIFLRDFMWPAMQKHGLCDIEIYLWDHNKERVYEWMRDIIDEETSPMIAGAACHWYSGSHFEALSLCREQFPDKKLIASESCVEFYKLNPEDTIAAAQKLGEEILGDLQNGVVAFYDWNLLLDEKGGPNYVKNYCLAPFIFDTQEGTLKPQLIQKYYECISSTVLPGSRRIALSRYEQDIAAGAFKRPDGKLVLLLLNRQQESRPVVIRLNGMEASVILLPESAAAAVIDQEAPDPS